MTQLIKLGLPLKIVRKKLHKKFYETFTDSVTVLLLNLLSLFYFIRELPYISLIVKIAKKHNHEKILQKTW